VPSARADASPAPGDCHSGDHFDQREKVERRAPLGGWGGTLSSCHSLWFDAVPGSRTSLELVSGKGNPDVVWKRKAAGWQRRLGTFEHRRGQHGQKPFNRRTRFVSPATRNLSVFLTTLTIQSSKH
jgi:hypothetical protein